MRKVILLLGLLLNNLLSGAQTIPDWSTAVAPILYQHCTPCHHGGGSGHGNFVVYDSAKGYAGSIAFYAATGYMPPWPPDTSRKFAHERRLTANEINTLQQWMLNGMPKGDTSLAPPPPVYNSGSQLSLPPDAVFKMPLFTIPQGAGGNDVYWNIVIPTNSGQNQFIRGFEFIPGNAAAVHHALVFVDTGNTVINNDAAYPGIGYPGFGGVGSNTAQLLGAYVPGSTPFLLPLGFGYRFPANSQLIFNMHYPASAVGQLDSSKINVYYTNGTVREVFITPALNHGATLVNGPLMIPPNQTRTFNAYYTIPVNVSVFGVAPHMHLIGRSIRSVAVEPPFTDTIPLINIPDWNFKWQGAYYFQKIQKLSANTKLFAQAFYDNTTSNPLNPSNPPITVNLGENTNDEMLLVYFVYTPYQPGDENIILDSTLLTTGINPIATASEAGFYVFPNPTQHIAHVCWRNLDAGTVNWQLVNLMGQVQAQGKRQAFGGPGTFDVNLAGLASGVYYMKITTRNGHWQTAIRKE